MSSALIDIVRTPTDIFIPWKITHRKTLQVSARSNPITRSELFPVDARQPTFIPSSAELLEDVGTFSAIYTYVFATRAHKNNQERFLAEVISTRQYLQRVSH